MAVVPPEPGFNTSGLLVYTVYKIPCCVVGAKVCLPTERALLSVFRFYAHVYYSQSQAQKHEGCEIVNGVYQRCKQNCTSL